MAGWLLDVLGFHSGVTSGTFSQRRVWVDVCVCAHARAKVDVSKVINHCRYPVIVLFSAQPSTLSVLLSDDDNDGGKARKVEKG